MRCLFKAKQRERDVCNAAECAACSLKRGKGESAVLCVREREKGTSARGCLLKAKHRGDPADWTCECATEAEGRSPHVCARLFYLRLASKMDEYRAVRPMC